MDGIRLGRLVILASVVGVALYLAPPHAQETAPSSDPPTTPSTVAPASPAPSNTAAESAARSAETAEPPVVDDVGSRTAAEATEAAPASDASAGQAAADGAAQVASAPDYSGFYAGAAGLSPSAAAGREIWYKATAGNDRFHTYVFQQRLGVLIDWYRVLNNAQRGDRFKTWGLINDPDCCTPGTPGCPAQSLEETYGFDWCPGDEQLLQYVGKTGYRDPACDFKDAPFDTTTPHGEQDQRQSACDLAFGTSTGALGLRKFPNPKFDEARWRKANGGQLGTWRGLNGKLSDDPANTDSKVSRLGDPTLEPPFRIGMACGACHIAFHPARPPSDPAKPGWDNIVGLIGNQYARFSEIMVSGMPTDSLEWQVFAHARPGTTDTSAVPTDQVNNTGTMNALINVAQRPTFANETVTKWRKVESCATDEDARSCWCEPGREGKCWQRGTQQETVHHILKGGGDSIGIQEALQRVYVNIGSCAEACWVNHLTDLRVIDPQQRGYGQTPFDIGQCRRDCPNFRAIEDRLPNLVDFVLSAEAYAVDLQTARESMRKAADPTAQYAYADLVDDLEQEFGQDAVSRGRTLFAENCAACHSSQGEPVAGRDFRELGANGLRADWLGNDVATPASEVGTFRCRSLHSNHMAGHIWEEYASETYRARPADAANPDPSGGGRGYYRNISLVNLWAHAPFMHNNALGPELCGWGGPAASEYDFYRNTYVDASGKLLDNAPECWPYDPSVEGRYALYKASMQDLLNPQQRTAKITKLDQDIVIDIGPKLWDGQEENKLYGLTLRVPAGTNAGLLGNFQHKPFIVDLVRSKVKPDELREELIRDYGDTRGRAIAGALAEVANEVSDDPNQFLAAVKQRLPLLLEVYSSCTADVENAGHEFGAELSDTDKQALIAFLATL